MMANITPNLQLKTSKMAFTENQKFIIKQINHNGIGIH